VPRRGTVRTRDTITTTVAFDRATYKRLRLLAVEEETNVRDLIRRAVAAYIESPRKGGSSKR